MGQVSSPSDHFSSLEEGHTPVCSIGSRLHSIEIDAVTHQSTALIPAVPCHRVTTCGPVLTQEGPDYSTRHVVDHDLDHRRLRQLESDPGHFSERIRFDVSKPEGTPKKLLDVSKAKSLGWEAKISLREGIKKTYDWYCNVRYE